MRPELFLDPERLHVHSRRLASVLDAVVPLPTLDADGRAALASTAAGRELVAEVDRSADAVERAARELSMLSAWLASAAAAARAADADAACSLARTDREQP